MLVAIILLVLVLLPILASLVTRDDAYTPPVRRAAERDATGRWARVSPEPEINPDLARIARRHGRVLAASAARVVARYQGRPVPMPYRESERSARDSLRAAGLVP